MFVVRIGAVVGRLVIWAGRSIVRIGVAVEAVICVDGVIVRVVVAVVVSLVIRADGSIVTIAIAVVVAVKVKRVI